MGSSEMLGNFSPWWRSRSVPRLRTEVNGDATSSRARRFEIELSRIVLDGSVQEGDKIVVDAEGGELRFDVESGAARFEEAEQEAVPSA
jgi:hypothetical protein